MARSALGRFVALFLGAAVLFALQYKGVDLYLTIIAGFGAYAVTRTAFALAASAKPDTH
jgi:hypothetical protein